MKRPRGPFEKEKQAKKARLGESSGSRPPAPLPGPSGKSVSLAPSVQTHHIASSIPQPTLIYTNSETPPSTTRTSHQPSQKFNLSTTTLPVFEEEMLNETTSPSSSSSPESPPYYNISTDTEHSDPPSPTLAQLQTCPLASQQPTQPTSEPEITSLPTEQPNSTTSDPPPSETPHAETHPNNSDTHPPNTSAKPQTPTLNLSPPTSPPLASEPENTVPTLEEAIMLFAEASVNKGFSEQVQNDFIRDAELRLQKRLAREAKERARKEAEEKARQEEMQRIKEVEAKALAVAAAAKAEAEAAAEAEARLAEESANRKFAEENLETSSHRSSGKNF
ncbi:extensin-like [Lathyrus oleraceus]|uniref:extensin-like n=1 Tax=Pisum sativum TaxID=3888 RepID=UPI0021CFFB3F|nr:extensin-like [Pisum sativum]